MKKIELARILEFTSQDCDRYSISIGYSETFRKYGKEGITHFVEHCSNAAGTKLIKGRISLKSDYIVSMGEELPYLKPSAVAEYSSH